MSLFSPHRRDAKGRAARLAGGAVLVLGIGITAAGLLGARLGLWGAAVHGPGQGLGNADRGAAIVPADPATAGGGSEDAGAGSGRRGIAGDAGTADDPGAGPGAEGEKLLEAWGHFERQIDAAMAQARESVVVLEYTARECLGQPAAGGVGGSDQPSWRDPVGPDRAPPGPHGRGIVGPGRGEPGPGADRRARSSRPSPCRAMGGGRPLHGIDAAAGRVEGGAADSNGGRGTEAG